jgi:hypothetical protein
LVTSGPVIARLTPPVHFHAPAEGAWNLCGSLPARARRAGRCSFSAGVVIVVIGTAGPRVPTRPDARASARPGAGTSAASRDGTLTRIGSGDIESALARK